MQDPLRLDWRLPLHRVAMIALAVLADDIAGDGMMDGELRGFKVQRMRGSDDLAVMLSVGDGLHTRAYATTVSRAEAWAVGFSVDSL